MTEPKTFLRNMVYEVQFSEFTQSQVRLIELIRRLVWGLFRKKKKKSNFKGSYRMEWLPLLGHKPTEKQVLK